MWRLGSRLAHKTIVVLGAAGNLGPVWVEGILAEGAKVVACGLAATSDSALQDLLATYDEHLVLWDLDITQPKDGGWDGVFGQLSPGCVDGVVLNAGIDSIPGSGKLSLTDYTLSDWQGLFAVNLFGVVEFLNTAIPYLSNPSSVVSLGSMYGVVSPKPEMYSHFNDDRGSIKNPAYGASKAALLAVTKQYGTYLAPQGVRVNMLTLGGVEAGQDPEFVRKFERHAPQEKMVPRQELPGAMVFLLSDDSLSMTGQNVMVDGGYTTW
jgi:NAD(P)-dependent dehydrogenase (short-subunit alcohol dehydrogenase family)